MIVIGGDHRRRMGPAVRW